MTDLEPCPFCSGEPERLKKTVRCKDCGAEGPYTSDDIYDNTCEKDWNTRASIPPATSESSASLKEQATPEHAPESEQAGGSISKRAFDKAKEIVLAYHGRTFMDSDGPTRFLQNAIYNALIEFSQIAPSSGESHDSTNERANHNAEPVNGCDGGAMRSEEYLARDLAQRISDGVIAGQVGISLVLEAAFASIRAEARTHAIPPGYVLVPEKPTAAMYDAAWKALLAAAKKEGA